MFHGLPEMVEYLSLRNRSEFPRSVNPTTGVNRPRPGRCFGRLPLTSNAGIGPVFIVPAPGTDRPNGSSRSAPAVAGDVSPATHGKPAKCGKRLMAPSGEARWRVAWECPCALLSPKMSG
jgi:hypothetical protein